MLTTKECNDIVQANLTNITNVLNMLCSTVDVLEQQQIDIQATCTNNVNKLTSVLYQIKTYMEGKGGLDNESYKEILPIIINILEENNG